MSARGHKRTFLLQDGVSAKSGHCGADRYSIFCLEIAQNEVGNFQIIAFGSVLQTLRYAKLIV